MIIISILQKFSVLPLVSNVRGCVLWVIYLSLSPSLLLFVLLVESSLGSAISVRLRETRCSGGRSAKTRKSQPQKAYKHHPTCTYISIYLYIYR